MELARSERRLARVFVPYEDVARMDLVHRRCEVLASDAKEHGVRFTLEASPRVIERLTTNREEDRR